MGIIEALGALFSAVGEACGLIRQRDAEKNSAPVQAAAAAQKEQDAEDRTRRAVASDDLAEERRESAE